jgi:hypothetical protein
MDDTRRLEVRRFVVLIARLTVLMIYSEEVCDKSMPDVLRYSFFVSEMFDTLLIIKFPIPRISP